MVFAIPVVEKLRLIMFLSQPVSSSLVLGLSAVVGCSSLSPFPCEASSQRKVPFSAGQLAELHPTSLPVPAWSRKSCLPLSVTNSSFSYSTRWPAMSVRSDL